MNHERPKVGIGVFVRKENKILLMQRKNAHGDGTWACPGGHLEYGEEIVDCGVREVLEETGVKIKNVKFFTITNDIFKKEGKHYITILLVADYLSGDVEIKEPEKFSNIGWFSWDKLPSPLFVSFSNLKKGENPMLV